MMDTPPYLVEEQLGYLMIVLPVCFGEETG